MDKLYQKETEQGPGSASKNPLGNSYQPAGRSYSYGNKEETGERGSGFTDV